MARGGKRPGAGRKPASLAAHYRARAAKLRAEESFPSIARAPAPKPASVPALAKQPFHVSADLLEIINTYGQQQQRRPEFNPFDPKSYHPPSVIPPKDLRAHEQIAMDSAISWASNEWMSAGSFINTVGQQGLLFPGYPFLSELAQRPEYDAFSDIIATEMTRKWIKFRGRNAKDGKPDEKADKIQELESFMDDLNVRDAYKTYAKFDGLMGRAHLFHEIAGNDASDGDVKGRNELGTSILKGNKIDPTKVNKDTPLTRLTNIEAVWVYPTTYNAQNPLAANYYSPEIWYAIGGRAIHFSRMPCLIGRPVPDMLKPAYSFGGLSLSQIAMPYVDIWLNTRESIGRLIKGFSTPVLMSDLQTLVQPGGGAMLQRATLFNAVRDNMSLFLLNKTTEDFKIEAVPLGGLSELQAQAQEHLSLPSGTEIETARGSIPIEDVTTDDLVLTRKGFAPIQWCGVTGTSDELIEIDVAGRTLRATGNHPIWSETTSDFVNAENVSPSHRLCVLKTSSQGNMGNLLLGADVGGGSHEKVITGTKRLVGSFMTFFGRAIGALSRTAMTFITETMTAPTIVWKTSNCLLAPSMHFATVISAKTGSNTHMSAANAEMATPPSASTCPPRAEHVEAVNIARVFATKVPRQPTYDITVADGWPPEFFAGGVLVHNCAVSRIPVAVYTGISPTGLNASSEGEIRIFENTIHAYQEARFRNPLNRTVEMCMLSLWGRVDEDIVYNFVPLREMSEKETAEINKMKAETDDLLVNGVNAIAPEEVRVRVAGDPDSGYDNIDPDDVPEPPEMVDPATGLPMAGGAGGEAGAPKPGGKINLTGHEAFAGGAKKPPKAANDTADG